MKQCGIGGFQATQIFLSFVLIQKKQIIKKQQAVREKTQWLRCYDCRCKTSCVVLQTQAPIVQRDATAFFLFLTSLLLQRSHAESLKLHFVRRKISLRLENVFRAIKTFFVTYQLFQPARVGTSKFSKI